MDDYNVNVLSEAKSEYSSRLVSILTPLMIEGIKSIFNEAYNLCLENEENEKYLMTFQNFLSRVPKWNTNIIEEETQRIIKKSKCNYLEDLLTCVHITQLKILTSIRVSQKQKKVDIDIPKLNTFVHKCYISYARKLYSNVYLFEKNILPLVKQKNMREAEVLCHECILQVIRDNMPVESILRAYIDETVDEEIIEETIEKIPTQEELNKIEKENKEKENNEKANILKTNNIATIDKPELKKQEAIETMENKTAIKPDETNSEQSNIELKIKEQNTKLKIDTDKLLKSDENKEKIIETLITNEKLKKTDTSNEIKSTDTNRLSFNDSDHVLDMGTNKENIVQAPKNIERLEEISKIQNEKRKAEEAEDDEEDKLTILDDSNLQLETLDIHDLNKKLEIEAAPLLSDIEILS